MADVIASHPLVAVLVSAALAGVAPRARTRDAVARRALIGPVSVLAIGKCAPEMMRGALDAIRPRSALMVALPGDHGDLAAAGVEILRGAHPDPAPDAAEHGERALDFAREAEGTLLVLVSGGGSAMLELPAEGISIDRLRAITRRLMHGGVGIEDLNVVRAALSRVKGGRLAAETRARVVTLVAEDVGGHPELVASGPTVPWSCARAREILDAHAISVDEGLLRALSRTVPSLTRPPDLEVVVDNADARRAVVACAAEHGLEMLDLGATLRGEARDAGAAIARGARAAQRAVVVGGETTVTVRGTGHGGRNQELVLGAADEAERGLICSFGTDGIDGASPHAGAFLDAATLGHARALGLDLAGALGRNDSAAFFEGLGTAVITGATGANAADVCFYVPS